MEPIHIGAFFTGQPIHLSLEFRNGAGALADATLPHIRMENDDGGEVADYTALSHVDTGLYTFDYVATIGGHWRGRLYDSADEMSASTPFTIEIVRDPLYGG